MKKKIDVIGLYCTTAFSAVALGYALKTTHGISQMPMRHIMAHSTRYGGL